ncbi:putative PEP-binding protein [Pseudomonas aeruginosa]
MAEGGATSHVAIPRPQQGPAVPRRRWRRAAGAGGRPAGGAGLWPGPAGTQPRRSTPGAGRLASGAARGTTPPPAADSPRGAHRRRPAHRIRRQSPPAARAAKLANGADGVGLLAAPSFSSRAPRRARRRGARNAYQEVLDAMGQRKVIIRTIDVGGDKHLDLPAAAVEENPALGLRGIRLGQARPELLDQQLRALLRVEPLERCRILLPMVSEVDELRHPWPPRRASHAVGDRAPARTRGG